MQHSPFGHSYQNEESILHTVRSNNVVAEVLATVVEATDAVIIAEAAESEVELALILMDIVTPLW